MTRRLRIATRGSRLALRQAENVAARVSAAHPDVVTEIVTVKTTGDVDRRPFSVIGGKGLFVAEVERALLDDRADIAVHSAKDLTAELAPGCTLVCVPERVGAHDVVVGGSSSTGELVIGSLPPGARVGTSSMRRRALLAEARPELEAIELRGNLDTRVRKVSDGEVDVAVLASAGMERLGIEGAAPLDPSWWVPAPAQGALAVEALADRTDVAELISDLDNPGARAEVECERAFAARLEGGCSVPLGCHAQASGNGLAVTGYLGMPDGSRGIRDRISGPLFDARALGVELAEAIESCGGDEILEYLKDETPPAISAP